MFNTNDTISSNNYGDFKIIQYTSWDNIRIKWLDCYGFEMTVTSSQIKSGHIRNPYYPIKYGVGYLGVGPYKTSVSGEQTTQYIVWNGMLSRCYNMSHFAYPVYGGRGVLVSHEWHNFQNFAEWFNENYVSGWELDKDILIKNNVLYSSSTCCFVPVRLNNILSNARKSRGDFPLGVSFHKHSGKFRAQMNTGVNYTHLGYFQTVGEAFSCYKQHKEGLIKAVATEFKEELPDSVYNSLMSWVVEKDD